jgi:hypothetical protein
MALNWGESKMDKDLQKDLILLNYINIYYLHILTLIALGSSKLNMKMVGILLGDIKQNLLEPANEILEKSLSGKDEAKLRKLKKFAEEVGKGKIYIT